MTDTTGGLKLLKSHRCFDGVTEFYEHASQSTRTTMKFSTFVPKGQVGGCLVWLSGLTCSDENFMLKAGAQRYLAEANLMIVCPDTSPRDLKLPGEHDSWDFGSGAGFYVDATTPGYRDHYRMYSYVSDELYELVNQRYSLNGRCSIFGHSMGGHGALVIGLREKSKFRSISAFAPIVNPTRCPWGQKAFQGYLGEKSEAWNQYDSCELLNAGLRHPQSILVDQGTSDDFLKKELLVENLATACREGGQKLDLRYRDGYDHSYFFISTFIGEHVKFHARAISAWRA